MTICVLIMVCIHKQSLPLPFILLDPFYLQP